MYFNGTGIWGGETTYLIKYELSQKKCFIFSRDKKMFVSRSVLKKKLCADFSEKKNITESNNLGPPPQKSNGASLMSCPR